MLYRPTPQYLLAFIHTTKNVLPGPSPSLIKLSAVHALRCFVSNFLDDLSSAIKLIGKRAKERISFLCSTRHPRCEASTSVPLKHRHRSIMSADLGRSRLHVAVHLFRSIICAALQPPKPTGRLQVESKTCSPKLLFTYMLMCCLFDIVNLGVA